MIVRSKDKECFNAVNTFLKETNFEYHTFSS